MLTCATEQRLTFRFESCMDTARCVEIEADLRNALDETEAPVVFDLADVTFISSSFLRLCVLALKRTGEGRFQIVHAAPMIKKVFKIAGLDRMFDDE